MEVNRSQWRSQGELGPGREHIHDQRVQRQDDSGLVRIKPTKGRRLCTGVMAIKTAGRRESYCWKPRRFPDYHRHVGNLPQTYHGKAVVEIPPMQMVILGLGDDLFSASL